MKRFLQLLSLVSSFSPVFSQKTVRYDLYVKDTLVNYSGKKAHAIAVNGQIAAPTLTFTEGDTAEIYLHNLLKGETSIHWHGLILPNEQDGVPLLTTSLVKGHTTHLYKFPIVQNGTYWYHSHTSLQEQSGLYGAIVIYKKIEPEMPEYTMVLSDWTNENPREVLRSLKRATDWYAIEKGSVQSYGEALHAGYLKQKLKQEWKRMFAMDVSDVYYDRFLLNGKIEEKLPQFKAGQKVRLRIVNGSSSTYFWLQYAGSKLTVVANDGQDVEPVQVDRMIIAIAETYDVIVTIPDNMSYEFMATSEDRTKSTSLWLGSGMGMSLPKMPTLKYFEGMKMMNSMAQMEGMKMSNQSMDMNAVMYPEMSAPAPMNMDSMKPADPSSDLVTLNYTMLRSKHKTSLDPAAPVQNLAFDLTGNMNRYVWGINNRSLSKVDKIVIRKGENIRIVLYNATMMRHPMHLHGHYFRVLNGQGEYAPLKNVLDMMPMERDTIEFAATEYGDWFFHCHVLYHMMSGMGRIFSYANSPVNSQIENPAKAWRQFLREDKMWHSMANVSLHSQGVFGAAMIMNTYNFVDADWHFNYSGSYAVEGRAGRYLDKKQFLVGYIGTDIRRHPNTDHMNMSASEGIIENRQVATLGIEYTLPLFIKADLRVDHTGRLRFQLMRNDLPLTARLRLDGMINTDKHYMLDLRYILTKYLSVSANYQNDYGLGGGMTLTY
jgi:FtsP/CotA-like multicopper oxidase with cupredoxin domain